MAKSNSNNSNGGSGIWGAVAQGAMAIGGGLIGGAQGKKAQKRQHGYNLDIMEKQNAYLHEQNVANQARQFDMWKKTNASAQAQEYKNAGLNVGLMYEGGGLQGTTGSTTSSSPSGGGNYSDLGLSSKGMEIGSQVAQTLANIELTKAQAENVKADTEMKTGVETDLKEAQITDITQGIQNKKAIETGQKLENRLKELEIVREEDTIDERIDEVKWNSKKALHELNLMAREDKMSEETYKDRVKIVTNSLYESIIRQGVGKAQITNTEADTALKNKTRELADTYAEVAKLNANTNQQNANINQQNATNQKLRTKIEEWKVDVDKQLKESGLDIQQQKVVIDGINSVSKLIDSIIPM